MYTTPQVNKLQLYMSLQYIILSMQLFQIMVNSCRNQLLECIPDGCMIRINFENYLFRVIGRAFDLYTHISLSRLLPCCC